MVRGPRRPDFASRIKVRLRTLRARLDRRDVMIDAVREANASLDPQTVGLWLVRQADDCEITFRPISEEAPALAEIRKYSERFKTVLKPAGDEVIVSAAG